MSEHKLQAKMSSAPFVVELIVVAIITVCLLHQYGNWRKQHLIVTIAVFIAWYFSFIIVFVLPLDVSSTCYRECKKLHPMQVQNNSSNKSTIPPRDFCQIPWSFLPKYVLPDLWRIVYWSSQLLSWIILPMMQSYEYAGEFTVLGKIKRALYENALWYGSYFLIFGILLVYVAVTPNLQLDGEHLRIIGITASNTWGLLLLIILMGYGLIELPRTAWYKSVAGHMLSHTLFKIAKLSTEKEDMEETLSETLQAVAKASQEIRYNSRLRKHIDTIIKKCPEASEEQFSKATDDYVDYDDVTGRSIQMYSEKSLVDLHKKVIVITERAHRTNVQWNMLLQKAFQLDDIERNRGNRDRIFKPSFSDHQPRKSVFSMSIEWYWKIWIRPLIYKLIAVLLFCFTIILIWSEMTFFSTKPKLSIFALLIGVAKKQYLYFNIEVICFFTIFYMCACTYYTVFKMRIFNYYYFALKHQTDANSLLFSGLLLCRLTYALCLNFLAMIHLDGHVTNINTLEQTSFTVFMGHMDVVSFISKGLNVYYPMTILLVCFCTYFNIGSRIFHCFGVQQFLVDEELVTEYVNEGKDIMRREKRRIERLIKGGRDWSERGRGTRHRGLTAHHGNPDGRIDGDNEDLDRLDSNSKTRLNEPRRAHYTKSDDDRLNLIDAMEQDRSPEVPRNTAYTTLGTSKHKGPPRNLFDDF